MMPRITVGFANMESRHLKPDQIAKVQKVVGPFSDYLGRMLARMEELGIPPEDDLRGATQAAAEAIEVLVMTLEAAHLEARKQECIEEKAEIREQKRHAPDGWPEFPGFKRELGG
jgi:hypothetical protein